MVKNHKHPAVHYVAHMQSSFNFYRLPNCRFRKLHPLPVGSVASYCMVPTFVQSLQQQYPPHQIKPLLHIFLPFLSHPHTTTTTTADSLTILIKEVDKNSKEENYVQGRQSSQTKKIDITQPRRGKSKAKSKQREEEAQANVTPYCLGLPVLAKMDTCRISGGL